MEREQIIFQDIVFFRYSASSCRTDRIYFRSGIAKKKFGYSRLHQVIWFIYNGKIPKGFSVHHKNFNSEDNRIENLECVSTKEHRKIHQKEQWTKNREKWLKYCSENLEKAHSKWKDWAKTIEGKNELRERAFRTIVLPPRIFICLELKVFLGSS